MHKTLLVFISFIFFSCATQKNNNFPIVKTFQKSDFSDKKLANWHLKDAEIDSIPGISLSKAYDLVNGKKSNEVIVAVVDAAFDLEHEDLKGKFWVNHDEILNNIDDDNNGFIDDLNGWNFIGNSEGSLPIYENYEFVRIVRFYNAFFANEKNIVDTSVNSKYATYLKAKKYWEEKIADVEQTITLGKPLIEKYHNGLKSISKYIENDSFDIAKLDSIGKIRPDLKSQIDDVKLPLLYDMNITDLEQDLEFEKRLLSIYYNLDYDERKEIGDDPNDINDSIYGNNLVQGLRDTISHGTMVSGLIAANRNNGIGIDGIVENVKILPVIVAVNGQAHDKDISLGIKYAVDKGADIINISINKKFSLHKEWVFDAIKYANEKDVLIIVAAGNDITDLDIEKDHYPNDTDYYSPEISDNFILVGGTSHSKKDNFFYKNSNYGQETVDIMGPAESINTTINKNKYEIVSGTSFSAPIVSGVAALIKSYYPELNAKEIKEIILNLGISIDTSIELDNDSEPEKSLPFYKLSKSGKIINAYNAMLMAKEFKKRKKL